MEGGVSVAEIARVQETDEPFAASSATLDPAVARRIRASVNVQDKAFGPLHVVGAEPNLNDLDL